MDKNQVIGLVLLGILFIVYFQFFAPEPAVPENMESDKETTQQAPEMEKETDSATPQISTPVDTVETVNDSISRLENQQKYGVFAQASQGEEKEITLENNLVRIVFSTKGGIVKAVELKEFKTYQKKPLILFDQESNDFSYLIDLNGKEIDLAELYYNTDASTNIQIAEGDTVDLTFRLQASGLQVVHHYSLAYDSYLLQHEMDTRELGVSNVILHWQDDIKSLEKDITESRNKTSVNYYLSSGDFEDLKPRSTDLEEEDVNSPIKWVSVTQKFFTSAIIANDPFNSGYVKTTVDIEDTSTVKSAEVLLEMPVNGDNPNNFTFYFGPNNYLIMNKVTDGFSKNINLGWPPINFVNKFLIIPIFHFLEKYISNYGIIIFILVILIRILLFPLSYKSHVSMAKTKALKPELDALKEKFGNDMQKMQSEQMKLYQKAGVNPISGCVPMLLQMPILFAMFYFFPNSIELRQESFLWADDLSTYDSIISWTTQIPLLSDLYGNHISLFTILMTLSTILYTWMNNQVSSVQGPMKSIGYVMPLVFMFVLNKFSAALTYYYFLSNLVSFGQQAVIRRYVDDSKIRAIIEDNKLKNKSKKKSKFQARLEEAMKASEEAKKKR